MFRGVMLLLGLGLLLCVLLLNLPSSERDFRAARYSQIVNELYINNAENTRQIDALCVRSGKKAINPAEIVVRHDLGEIELAGKSIVGDVIDLLGGIGVWIRPAAQRQPRDVLSNFSAQLPRVAHASRRPDGPIAAEHDKRWKPFLPGAFGI